MSSIDLSYSVQEQQILYDIAQQSIELGLRTGNALSVDLSGYSEHLRQLRATFVTLKKQGELRGCIGTLSAIRPLVSDVAHNAFAAAFEDPRFLPLERSEKDALDLSISVLSDSEPMAFASEKELLDQIRPGIDGLILSDGYHRGTFLPSVWESLPQPQQFLAHLKQKAGLPTNYWSDGIKVERYITFSFGEPNLAH